MIIPGIVSATFRERPAEELIDICVKANLKAIEWSEKAHVMPNDTDTAKHLLRMCEQAGIAVAAYGSYYRLGQYMDPIGTFAQSLRAAAAMHAPLIRIWAGTKASADTDKAEEERLAKEAACIAGIAERENIKVAFEWHKNTLTDTNASAVRFLEKADHENLYCLWQPTAALDMKQRVNGLDMLAGRNRLLNLHVYYWRDGKRRPFTEGKAEWEAYLDHVPAEEDRFGLLEFVMGDDTRQLQDDANVWNDIVSEYNGYMD